MIAPGGFEAVVDVDEKHSVWRLMGCGCLDESMFRGPDEYQGSIMWAITCKKPNSRFEPSFIPFFFSALQIAKYHDS